MATSLWAIQQGGWSRKGIFALDFVSRAPSPDPSSPSKIADCQAAVSNIMIVLLILVDFYLMNWQNRKFHFRFGPTHIMTFYLHALIFLK